jgi:hypothetical protein
MGGRIRAVPPQLTHYELETATRACRAGVRSSGMSRDASRVTRPKVGLLAVLTLASASGAYAQSGEADWQMYGRSGLASTGIVDQTHGDNLLFFDAAGIVHRRDGHIEVWTKALPRKELEAQPANEQMTKKFIDFTKQKIANGYVPPLFSVTELDANGRLYVLAQEAAANMAGIVPTLQILYELDCTNRVLRALSLHARGYPSDDTASEWMHEPPESPGATLIKILCK